MSQTILELDEQAFDALVTRLSAAKEHGLALSAKDTQLVLDALMTLAQMQQKLNDKDITVKKLRKLLGIVKSSEKLSDLISNDEQGDTDAQGGEGKLEPPPKQSSNSEPKKKPKSKPITPSVTNHKLEGLSKGDLCSECNNGKLGKYEPARLLRIKGCSPFVPELHLSERLRCNACGAFFTAQLSKKVLDDGDSNQKYGYSARSLIVINKYWVASPFFRTEGLQNLLGQPITASTQFDQCEYVANDCHPILKCFKRLAADALHFSIDDTTHRILNQIPVKKKSRNSNTERIRSGVYCSGLIAELADGHKIVLFETSIGHAGEFLDDILGCRTAGLLAPTVMSDALSSNHVTMVEIIISLCNAHGRREFVDVLSHFPAEVEQILNDYKLIWKQEKEVKKEGLSPQARQLHHKEHSLPIMEKIRTWGNDKLESETVDENSGLGKAIRYFDKHFDGLTRFCTHVGAKLDNNETEQTLKAQINIRKNAHFYKTLAGASVADTLISLIATTRHAEINPFEYLTAIQRNRDRVRANPEQWMPWNYEKSLVI